MKYIDPPISELEALSEKIVDYSAFCFKQKGSKRLREAVFYSRLHILVNEILDMQKGR